MKYIVVFKKRSFEKINPYSIVDDQLLGTIREDIVLAKKEVEDKLYSKEELEKLRDSLI